MTDLLQLLFAGLSQGAVYALVAIGFVAIFTVSGVINLAQGEFAALAGLVAISAVGSGLPLLAAVVLAVVSVALVAVIMERLVIFPVKRMTTLVSLILTLGVSTGLKALMLLVYGPNAEGLTPLTPGGFSVAGVSIRYQELWILLIAGLVSLAVYWFYERTLAGKSLRACAEQPVAARLVGISLTKASLISFLIAGTVGAIAGVLASPIYFTSWESGLTLGLKGFVAATLGGLISVRGAVLGGLLLGVLETLTAGYISTGLRDAVAFLLLIIVLVARPAGIFGRTAEARV
ncbi:branched-chain amino acid ABC transporter permease [Modestobacter marinus]|uniref:Branched-chain amino acid ABC transporter permease n=1 Tax=Modestobacter marinus TaxID=477641 RepID=A0A846LN22_9ACTN|nr:branched-chain amino acid ABC transporter permease [Modestobacter marinus]NIH68847.1 branched-chain amino acid transport system permease protein [Modestobacter marinus]GGL60478.1 branched-chain amino acid ABC transporter permease [Modestobacter marinus]